MFCQILQLFDAAHIIELYTRSVRLACYNALLEAHTEDFMMHYDPFSQKVLVLSCYGLNHNYWSCVAIDISR